MGFFDDGVGAALGGAASGILGTASSAWSAHYSWKKQKEAMQNAHQWEVEDLRKAGLNPILSATGGSGASTGGLNVPQIDTSGISSAFKNYIQGSLLKGQLEQQKAGIELTKAQTGAANAGNALASAQAANAFWNASQLERDYQYYKANPHVYDAVMKNKVSSIGGLAAVGEDIVQDLYNSAKSLVLRK